MFCPRCGLELPNNANFCQRCGLQFQQNAQQMQYQPEQPNTMYYAQQPYMNMPQGKKKDSALSIVACLLALFTLTCFIGFIVGIIDIGTGAAHPERNEKHVGSWFAIIYTTIILSVLIFG